MNRGLLFFCGFVVALAVAGIAVGIYFAVVGTTPPKESPPKENPPPAPKDLDIRFYNNSDKPFTVWLEGSQPPCNKEQASKCHTWQVGEETPESYAAKWKALAPVFEQSGTKFSIYDGKTTRAIPVSNSVELKPGETFILQPPVDANGQASWYYMNREKTGIMKAGLKAWVAKTGISMPASERTILFEFNPGVNPGTKAYEMYWDISAVDGINAKATMEYGDDISVANTDIGKCLYQGTNTCQNLKFQPEATFNAKNVVAENFNDIWVAAGKPSNKEMAQAASGDPLKKKAYHIYWAMDPQAQAYLNWLQRDADGKIKTNAYGWAYDEKKWKEGVSFDVNGNPENDNKEVDALRSGLIVKGKSLEIKVTDII